MKMFGLYTHAELGENKTMYNKWPALFVQPMRERLKKRDHNIQQRGARQVHNVAMPNNKNTKHNKASHGEVAAASWP